MKVCEFSGWSVKYTRHEFYISRLGNAIDLKFSPELDIVKTNLLAKVQPNKTSDCPVIGNNRVICTLQSAKLSIKDKASL